MNLKWATTSSYKSLDVHNSWSSSTQQTQQNRSAERVQQDNLKMKINQLEVVKPRYNTTPMVLELKRGAVNWNFFYFRSEYFQKSVD